MNNQQFRKLLAEQAARDGTAEVTNDKQQNTTSSNKRSAALGMAPRALKRSAEIDFSRQKHERNTLQPSAKKFKSSTPKGVTMAAGFTDRARERAEAEEDTDEKAVRIKSLEEELKQKKISRETFERLREEIAGGDTSSTHLIKGLDRKLLDRVRRGEDVLGLSKQPEAAEVVDVDEELDKLEDIQVEAVQKEKVEKKGAAAPAKRTRNEILAELKAARQAAIKAQAAAKPVLANGWRSIDDKTSRRIEIDRKGREVLITTDKDGVVKKMIRKIPKTTEPKPQPDTTKEVLRAESVVSEIPKVAPAPDDEDDIFEDAGTDYDPLGPDADSEDEDGAANNNHKQKQVSDPADNANDQPTQRRNYFNDTPVVEEQPTDHLAGIKAVIEKASKSSRTIEAEPVDEAEAARRARHAEMLANRDRDLDDMDMGFGASRYEDGEDGGDGEKVRLSEWKGSKHDGDDEPEDRRNHDKKKRRPRKRKGDGNNFADIMTVIERRKKASE